MKLNYYAMIMWTAMLCANTAYGENFTCPAPAHLEKTIPDGWDINSNDINKSRTNLKFTEAAAKKAAQEAAQKAAAEAAAQKAAQEAAQRAAAEAAQKAAHPPTASVPAP